MKKSICGGILALAVALLTPHLVQAQGTLYFTSLDKLQLAARQLVVILGLLKHLAQELILAGICSILFNC